jgi:hypothetical protein
MVAAAQVAIAAPDHVDADVAHVFRGASWM